MSEIDTKELATEAISMIVDWIKSSDDTKRLEAIKALLSQAYAQERLEGKNQKRLYDLTRPQLYLIFKKIFFTVSL